MTSAARPQPRFLRARAWRRARIQQLAGFNGLLQVDGYAAYYRALADPARAGGPVTLAYCWSHVRRRFYEIAQGCNAPLAEDALQRIAALYRIEDTIRGHAPEQRHTLRRDQSRPIVDGLRVWLDAQLVTVPGGSRIAEAIRYALKLSSGLVVFLDDGRVEIDSNVVERSIRPIALSRKNALFAGSDQGGVHWGIIASPIETAKLNAVDPQAYLAYPARQRPPRQPDRPAHALGLRRPRGLTTALTVHRSTLRKRLGRRRGHDARQTSRAGEAPKRRGPLHLYGRCRP